jgi:hypothetical protein
MSDGGHIDRVVVSKVYKDVESFRSAVLGKSCILGPGTDGCRRERLDDSWANEDRSRESPIPAWRIH